MNETFMWIAGIILGYGACAFITYGVNDGTCKPTCFESVELDAFLWPARWAYGTGKVFSHLAEVWKAERNANKP